MVYLLNPVESVLLVYMNPLVFLVSSAGIDPSGFTLVAAFTSICIPDTSPGRKEAGSLVAGWPATIQSGKER